MESTEIFEVSFFFFSKKFIFANYCHKKMLLRSLDIVLIVSFVYLAVKGVSECEGGGWLFRNRCYWLITEPVMPWADANLYCTKVGTDLQLAVIQNEETNVCIRWIRKITHNTATFMQFHVCWGSAWLVNFTFKIHLKSLARRCVGGPINRIAKW